MSPENDAPALGLIDKGRRGQASFDDEHLPLNANVIQRTAAQAGVAAESSHGPLSPPALAETSDTYPRVIAALNAGWRVIRCRDDLQWILQHRKGRADGWRGQSFCRSRDTLNRCIREHAGDIDRGALVRVDALPAFITRGGKWLR